MSDVCFEEDKHLGATYKSSSASSSSARSSSTRALTVGNLVHITGLTRLLHLNGRSALVEGPVSNNKTVAIRIIVNVKREHFHKVNKRNDKEVEFDLRQRLRALKLKMREHHPDRGGDNNNFYKYRDEYSKLEKMRRPPSFSGRTCDLIVLSIRCLTMLQC